jgi:5'(3')-deoxyribonucleotidase
MTRKTLLLDMDGVIANFHGACCNLFEITEQQLLEVAPPPHEYAIEKYIGRVLGKEITDADLWDAIDNSGQFWLEIEPYPWLWDLWNILKESGHDIVVSSNPHKQPWNVSSTITWLRYHLPELGDRAWMFGKDKTLMASTRTILLDDCEHNTGPFSKFGHSILFPQPWNDNHGLMERRLEYVKERLIEIG